MKTVTRLSLVFATVLTLSAVPVVRAADIDPPTVTAPLPRMVLGHGLTTTAIPVGIRWSGTDDFGITKYVLQQSTDGGSWATVALASPTAYGVTRWTYSGHYYQFRVVAYDAANNSSGWVTGPLFRSLGYQETSGSFTSGWGRRAMAGAFGGYVKTAKVAGQYATFAFTGRSIAWVAPRYWSGWQADVYIDGVGAGRVDLYSGTTLYRKVVFARTWSTSGPHTIKVRVANAVNPYHPNVDIDAWVVLR